MCIRGIRKAQCETKKQRHPLPSQCNERKNGKQRFQKKHRCAPASSPIATPRVDVVTSNRNATRQISSKVVAVASKAPNSGFSTSRSTSQRHTVIEPKPLANSKSADPPVNLQIHTIGEIFHPLKTTHFKMNDPASPQGKCNCSFPDSMTRKASPFSLRGLPPRRIIQPHLPHHDTPKHFAFVSRPNDDALRPLVHQCATPSSKPVKTDVATPVKLHDFKRVTPEYLAQRYIPQQNDPTVRILTTRAMESPSKKSTTSFATCSKPYQENQVPKCIDLNDGKSKCCSLGRNFSGARPQNAPSATAKPHEVSPIQNRPPPPPHSYRPPIYFTTVYSPPSYFSPEQAHPLLYSCPPSHHTIPPHSTKPKFFFQTSKPLASLQTDPLKRRSIKSQEKPDTFKFYRLACYMPLDLTPPNLSTSSLFKPAETLIVFDWDDTFLPSSWLGTYYPSSVSDGVVKLSKQDLYWLDLVSDAVQAVIVAAIQLGHVVIVTNSKSGWVETSCMKYLPRIYHLLYKYNIQIVTVRGASFQGYKSSLMTWKLRAFQEISAMIFNAKAAAQRHNIISIGDSNSERMAIMEHHRQQKLKRPYQPIFFKSLKLLEKSCPLLLTNQVLFSKQIIARMVHYSGNLDLQINLRL